MPALVLALSLLAAAPAAQAAQAGEPLPPGAPTAPYPLAAWCYGALSEYLDVYDHVKPDLIAIDKEFGPPGFHETTPYAHDMAAARVELKMIGHAVQAAEQASPTAIAPQGVEALNLGRSIWRPVETKTSRELARAWLTWALPDRCDSNARELAAKSALLGQALSYNQPSATDAAAAPADIPATAGEKPDTDTPPPADAAASTPDAGTPADTAPAPDAKPESPAPDDTPIAHPDASPPADASPPPSR